MEGAISIKRVEDVRALVAEGMSAAEIGRTLGLGPSTARELAQETKLKIHQESP